MAGCAAGARALRRRRRAAYAHEMLHSGGFAATLFHGRPPERHCAELGVSVVTVSRALRNRPDIAEKRRPKFWNA